MTCIVGLELGDGRVLFGADSMVSTTDAYDSLSAPKVWRSGSMVVGAAGMFYQFLQLQHTKLPRPPGPTANLDEWILGKLVPDIQESLRKVAKPCGENDSPDDLSIVIGVNGAVYYIEPMARTAYRSRSGYVAIGNGCDVALGSLYTTARLSADGVDYGARDRVEMAIQAAASRCLGVGGPIVMLEGSTATRPATARKGKASGGKASGGGKVGRRRAKPKAGKRRA